MDLSPLDWCLVAFLIFLGGIVQTTLGFGLAVVASPFLIMIDPELVPGPALAFGLVSALITLWWNRAALALRELTLAFVARVPGTLLALPLVAFAPAALLAVLLGSAVLIAVAVSVRAPRIERTRTVIVAAGFMSGLMGTATSIGGPPMALAYQSASGPTVRANLAAYMSVGMVTSLLALALIGRFGLEQLQAAVWMVVPVVTGVLVGRWLSARLQTQWLRPATLTVCAFAGLVAAGKGLASLVWG